MHSKKGGTHPACALPREDGYDVPRRHLHLRLELGLEVVHRRIDARHELPRLFVLAVELRRVVLGREIGLMRRDESPADCVRRLAPPSRRPREKDAQPPPLLELNSSPSPPSSCSSRSLISLLRFASSGCGSPTNLGSSFSNAKSRTTTLISTSPLPQRFVSDSLFSAGEASGDDTDSAREPRLCLKDEGRDGGREGGREGEGDRKSVV